MSPRNIVIAGETGVGKSSLINLVVGEDAADTSNDAVGVTTEAKYHSWMVGDQEFRLWDTPGLGEGSHGNVSPKRAEEVLQSLLTQLHRKSGVHLLILCMRGISKVTKGMKQTYDTIIKIRSKVSSQIPIVAVVTELEKKSFPGKDVSSMDEWWSSNTTLLDESQMNFFGHACITTLFDDCHPPMPGRRERCQQLVRDLIQEYALPPKDLHIVLFGETGVGKSSLINLVAGENIAMVSPDSQGCTLDSKEYAFPMGFRTIRLWDTVGLEEPDEGVNGYLGAIEKAIELIRRLNAVGGMSLLLFCIRGNRITATTQSNYRLFFEVLGKKEVPIALAITHLEREAGEMEHWWPRNVKTLEKYGIISGGHVCLTCVEDNSRYLESRDAIRALLSRYADQGKFLMPAEAWIGRLLKGLGSLVGEKNVPKGKEVIRVLTKRCHLELAVAQRVAAWLLVD